MLACQWVSILLFADLRRDSDHMWSPTGHRKVLESILQEVGLSALPSKMPAAWPQQNFIFKSCCCCGVMCSIHYMCVRPNRLLYLLLLRDQGHSLLLQSNWISNWICFRHEADALQRHIDSCVVRLPPVAVQCNLSHVLHIRVHYFLQLVVLYGQRDMALVSYESGYGRYVARTGQARTAAVYWYRCSASAPGASAIQLAVCLVSFGNL